MMWCLVGGEGEGVILLSSSIDRRPSHQSHLRTMSLEQNFQRKARINLFRSRILSHSPHNLRQEITMKIKGWQLQIFWRKYHHLHLAEDSWYAAMHLVQTFCGAAMTDSKSRHLKKRLGLSVRVLQDLDKKAREIFRNVLRGTKAGSSPPPLDLLSFWQSNASAGEQSRQQNIVIRIPDTDPPLKCEFITNLDFISVGEGYLYYIRHFHWHNYYNTGIFYWVATDKDSEQCWHLDWTWSPNMMAQGDSPKTS